MNICVIEMLTLMSILIHSFKKVEMRQNIEKVFKKETRQFYLILR